MDSEDEDLAFNLQLCELSQALCDEDAKRKLSSNALFNSQFGALVKEQELAMNRLAERRKFEEGKRGHEEGKRRQEEERRKLQFEEEKWRREEEKRRKEEEKRIIEEKKRRQEEEKRIIEEKKRRQEEQDRHVALELAHRLMSEESGQDYYANLGENGKSLSELLKDQELELKRIALSNQQIKDQNKSPSSASQHDVLDCHPHEKYGKSRRQNRSTQSPQDHSANFKTESHDPVVTAAYHMSRIVIPDQDLDLKGKPNRQAAIPGHKCSQKGKKEFAEMRVRTQNLGADLRHSIDLDYQQQYVPFTSPSRLPQHIPAPALPRLSERSSVLAQEALLPPSTKIKDPPTMTVTMPITPKESLEATAPPYRMALPPVKCPQCMVHNGLSCIDFQVAFDGNSMEHMWNHCPKCDAHVPWHYGCCNHVACRCGYQFCSICGWEWSPVQINTN